jgi:hypothetical protein
MSSGRRALARVRVVVSLSFTVIGPSSSNTQQSLMSASAASAPADESQGEEVPGAESTEEQGKNSWRQAAGREKGRDSYQFGDVSRALIHKAKGAAVRSKAQLQKGGKGEDDVFAEGEVGGVDSDVRAPVLSTVVRGAGQVFGAGKGLVTGATLGVVKAGVALTDKLYEASSSTVASKQDRERFNSKISFAAKSFAAEVAPMIGNVVSTFAQGSLEGATAANRGLHTAYERVVPEGMQQDLAIRLEKRFGAVMEHLIEPAVLEAVQNLYMRKVKPELVSDRMAPDLYRRGVHDVADQLWSDLMLELPGALSLLVDTSAGGARAGVPPPVEKVAVAGGVPSWTASSTTQATEENRSSAAKQAPTPPPSPPDSMHHDTQAGDTCPPDAGELAASPAAAFDAALGNLGLETADLGPGGESTVQAPVAGSVEADRAAGDTEAKMSAEEEALAAAAASSCLGLQMEALVSRGVEASASVVLACQRGEAWAVKQIEQLVEQHLSSGELEVLRANEKAVTEMILDAHCGGGGGSSGGGSGKRSGDEGDRAESTATRAEIGAATAPKVADHSSSTSTPNISGKLLVDEPAEGSEGCSSIFGPNATRLLDVGLQHFLTVRAHLLYNYAPFDKSIWGRLRSPTSALLLAIGSWPSWGVRCAFFAVLLAFLLVEVDEYQLMQFIMSLKGSQFVTGLFLSMEGFVIFFSCAVMALPSNCDAHGPGVGLTVSSQASFQIFLQALTWAAFGLLPFSSQCGEVTLLGRQQRREELARRTKERMERKRQAAASKRTGRFLPWRRKAADTSATAAPAQAPSGYARLEDAAEAGNPPERPLEEAEAGRGGSSSGGCQEGAAATLHEDGDEQEGEVRGGWARIQAWFGSLATRHNYSNNRIVHLMGWDVFSFASCTVLFVVGAIVLAAQEAADSRSNGSGAPSSTIGLLFSGRFWASWRVEVYFFLVRMVYALSALPFLIFHLPLIRSLLSHTFPTGFTSTGVCVPHDSVGLSSFAQWLEVTLPSMRSQLTSNEATRVERMLTQAKACLKETDEGRGGASKVTTDRKLRELESVLAATIPQSHALFPVCFPETQICVEYERAAAEAREARKRAAKGPATAYTSWSDQQAAKYGVEWQRDHETHECTLCEAAFTIIRRRHRASRLSLPEDPSLSSRPHPEPLPPWPRVDLDCQSDRLSSLQIAVSVAAWSALHARALAWCQQRVPRAPSVHATGACKLGRTNRTRCVRIRVTCRARRWRLRLRLQRQRAPRGVGRVSSAVNPQQIRWRPTRALNE